MLYSVEKIVLTTLCQKCSAPPTKTPLVDFKLPNGLLWIPEFLFCPNCGNYVTIHQRDMTEGELKERDEKIEASTTLLAELPASVCPALHEHLGKPIEDEVGDTSKKES